ncbi:hypothetical protein ASZ78_017116 [Callipepla squamata]|uniref:DUF4209 domain-containing protein n=1 Tax=Callipepla squamata TaxID=9009 RepID=A0A226NCS0_CALSU|nr:hypothetical protein ASZ78_017116 [Callipepla squamata]
MASSDSVTTCLSSAVHYVICKLGFEKKEIYDIDNIVSENGEVHWQAITEHVHYLEPVTVTEEYLDHIFYMDVLRIFIGSPYGLNLRNVLWHGFASPQEIPVKYADCVILLLPQLEVGLRLLFTTANKCPNRLLTAESSVFYTTFDEVHLVIKPLMNCASCYRSRFHPISRLKKQVLECMKSIHSWHELPTVSEEHIQTIKGLEGSTEASTLVLMMTEILTQLLQYLPCNCYISDDLMSTVATESHICTLYSPRPVLEVLVVLRKISTQCHQVSEQVIASIKSRYQQWTEKTLRSRQRHNYLRMLNSIKFLSPVLRLILVLITLELVNVHLVCKKNPSDYHQYVKFLKSVLQYAENLVTYTSPEKNKWDETVQLTNKALIKIRKFSDGKLTLIQSVK